MMSSSSLLLSSCMRCSLLVMPRVDKESWDASNKCAPSISWGQQAGLVITDKSDAAAPNKVSWKHIHSAPALQATL